MKLINFFLLLFFSISFFTQGITALNIPAGGHVITICDQQTAHCYYIPVPSTNLTILESTTSENVIINEPFSILLEEDHLNGFTWNISHSNGFLIINEGTEFAKDLISNENLEKSYHYWEILPTEPGKHLINGFYSQNSGNQEANVPDYSLEIIVNGEGPIKNYDITNNENKSNSKDETSELNGTISRPISEKSAAIEDNSGDNRSTPENTTKFRLMGFKEQTLSKGVNENSGEPYGITKTFLSTDERVCSILHFDPLVSDSDIEWRWYDPNGNLYRSFRDQAEKGWDWLFCYIDLKNYEPSSKPGEWFVDFLFNGEVIDSKNFTIEIDKTPSFEPISASSTPNINYGTGTPPKNCPGITECGNNCCGPSEGCCYTANGPVCYNPLTHVCANL